MVDKKKKPEDKKLGDYVEFEMDGIDTPVPVYKENLSDEEWAQIKADPRARTGDQVETTIQNGRKAKVVTDGMSNAEIKALAGKLDKPGDAGDYVVVGPNKGKEGDSAYVYPRRAKETDEEWNKRVSELEKHPRYESRAGVANRQQAEAKAEAQDKQGEIDRIAEEVVRDPKTKQTAQFSDYDRGVMERMNEDDRRKFVRDRMKSKGTPVSEGAATGTAKREGGGTMMGKFGDAVKSLVGGAVPEEGGRPTPAPSSLAGGVELARDSIAPEGPNPDGGVPDPVGMSGGPSANAPVLAPEGPNPDGGVVNPIEYTSGTPVTPPRTYGSSTADNLIGGVKQAFTSGAELNANIDSQNLGDPLDAPVPPLNAPAPTQPLIPPGAPGAPGAPTGSFKLSGSSTTNPSKPYVPAVDPYYAQQELNAQAGFEFAKDLATKKGEMAIHQADMETQAQRKLLSDQAQLSLERVTGENAFNKTMADGQVAISGLMDERRQLAQKNVDPGRYWSNKDSGQKAAATIAGFLFGFTGQGMQYLQRLDGLMNDDIKLQQDELARQSGNIDSLIGDQKNIIALGEKQGLSKLAAVSAAKAARIEEYQTQMGIIASSASSEQARVNAQMGIQALEQKKQEYLASAHSNMVQDAHIKSSDAVQWARLAEEKRANSLNFAAKAAKEGGGGEKFDPQQLSRLAAIDKALAAADKARESVKDTGWTDSVSSTFAGALQGLGFNGLAADWMPDAVSKTSAAEGAQETVLKGVMGEAIQEADNVRNKPRFVRPGLGSENTGWLDAQVDVLTQERNAIIENARRVGRDTGTLSPLPTQQAPSINFTPSK